MATNTNDPDLHGGRMRVPRSRGAFSGLVLVILGAWGALIPFIAPYVNFGYTPNSAFHLTAARFWLELLPGVVAAVGGLLLLVAANRLVTSLGAWLAVAAGAWFVVGPTLDRLVHLGAIGSPIHSSTLGSTLETLLLFTGIGALILFLGALAVGRLGVVSVRDVRAAQRREREKGDDESSARDARIEAREAGSPNDPHNDPHNVPRNDSSGVRVPDRDDRITGSDRGPVFGAADGNYNGSHTAPTPHRGTQQPDPPDLDRNPTTRRIPRSRHRIRQPAALDTAQSAGMT